ncbi:MAG: TolC family protein, partial [Muribaculaceae bacterium]|nr:TolC family protein [Muribaculaceae bacterium]
QAANTLAGPEAEFEYLKGQGGATKWTLGVNQSFDWPGLYKARKTANEMNRSVYSLLYDSRRIEIATEANTQLIRYKYVEERRKLLSDIFDALTNLEKSLKTALDHGLVTILDYKKAGIERYGVERDIRLASADLSEIKSNLDQLAGRELDWSAYSPALTPELTQSVDDYLETARRSDPSFLASLVSIEAAKREIDVAKAETLPTFSIGYRHEREEGIHFNGFAVSIGLPTWGISQRKMASSAALKAVQAEAGSVGAVMTARITNEWKQARALKLDLDEVSATAIDRDYLKLLKLAYEGGELSVLDYIRELSYCREVTMNIIDLKERYEIVMASLNRYNL